jgi:hypothetical protein
VVSTPDITSGNTYTIRTGGSVSGADENGYAAGCAYSGGSVLATIEMTSLHYGQTSGMGGGMGGIPASGDGTIPDEGAAPGNGTAPDGGPGGQGRGGAIGGGSGAQGGTIPGSPADQPTATDS